MKALVYLEDHAGQITKASAGVLSKAATLGLDSVDAVIVGASSAGLSEQAGRFGAEVVHLASGDEFAAPLSQPRVDVLEQVVGEGGYDLVLFANSVLAADVAAGLSARLGAGLNWDLIDLSVAGDEVVGSRLALGDSVLVEVGWRSPVRLALFRAGSFEPAVTERQAEARAVTATLRDYSRRAEIVEQRPSTDSGPSLEGAEVVISGGMGLGAAEHFALAEHLAELLGGVVGATRAAVYAGWYPHSAQVGQTGKTVTPKLYLALGISGAVQHKVGMQNSKAIVAINKDPAAPIFEFSDLAVVGDVHVIVPQLIDLLKQRKGA